ncbi:MAG: lipopolysaccharide transport system permease protein [Candidatus Azotimanducaceae bacterium]
MTDSTPNCAKDYKMPPSRPTSLLLELTHNLTRRNLLSQYQGTLLGFAWALLTPLMLLGIYTLVFTGLFNARWPGSDAPSHFALHMFAGMIIHAWFGEAIQRAPALFSSDAALVTKMAFPLSILPIAQILASGLQVLASLALLIVFAALYGMMPGVSLLALPLILIPFAILLTSLSIVLSALGVYLRDLSMITGFISTGLLFLSPVFYPLEGVPEPWRTLIYLNPLAFPIESIRQIIFNAQWPNFIGVVCYCVVSMLALGLSIKVLNRLRGGFADVI